MKASVYDHGEADAEYTVEELRALRVRHEGDPPPGCLCYRCQETFSANGYDNDLGAKVTIRSHTPVEVVRSTALDMARALVRLLEVDPTSYDNGIEAAWAAKAYARAIVELLP